MKKIFVFNNAAIRIFWIGFFLLLIMGCDTFPELNQLEPNAPDEPEYQLKQEIEPIQDITTKLSSENFKLEASVNLDTTELTSAKYRITNISIRM